MGHSLQNIIILALITLVLGGCASEGRHLKQSHSGSQQLPPPASLEESVKAQKLWQVFQRYEGTPYQYGGTSSSGFDCSGFILTAYQEGLGKQLPRTTSQMLAHGDVVHPSDLEPGDVVFFRIDGKDQHAGIYIGDGRFIHSSSSVGVTQSNLNGYYWAGRLSKARRFARN
ncbi:MAG: C40 family peptidase [Pseudomonadota bacterium]